MKKVLIGSLFVFVLLGTFVHAKENGLSISRFTDPLSVSFQKDDTLSLFEAENWWLKKYPDIVKNSSYFYAPLDGNKTFSGMYLRFHKNGLSMIDYIVKDSVTKTQLSKLFTSLGKSTLNGTLGTRTVTKKNGTTFLISTDQRPYRLIAISAAGDLSLAKGHVSAKKRPAQQKK